MRHSSLFNALRFLTYTKNKKLARLWDKAEPVSLEELKIKFADLARSELGYKVGQATLVSEEVTFEELWRIFESLEELEDWPVIY